MSGIFDPERDPFIDVQHAITRARREKKNVLLHVGGDWCKWCQRLEDFIQDHSDLRQLRDTHYVVVHVYCGIDDNPNEDFLSHLPSFHGLPHLYVYNGHGQLLCSQNTAPLEVGESYDPALVGDFLQTWADWRLSPFDSMSADELQHRFTELFFPSDPTGPTLSA